MTPRHWYAHNAECCTVHTFPTRATRDAWLANIYAIYGADPPVTVCTAREARYFLARGARTSEHTI